MSKGSSRRPCRVPDEDVEKAWARIFEKKKKPVEKPLFK